MNHRLHAGLLLAAAVFVQVAFAQDMKLFGVKPEPVLVLVYLIGLNAGDMKGVVYGAIGGLAVDCLSGGLLGLCASGYGLVGFFAGRLRVFMFEVGRGSGFMGLFSLSLAEGAYAVILIGTLIGGYGMADTVIRYALPQAAYNAAIGVAVLWLVREDNVLRYRTLHFIERWEVVY